MRAFSIPVLAFLGVTSRGSVNDGPQLPPPQVVLRIDAPDPAGPWRMVVTNNGEVPVRFAADGRLLRFEMPKADDPYESPAKKKAKATAPVVCKLPSDLRPAGVVENRAVVLGPGARYEEVVGVREGGSILAEIQRMRPSITPHELNVLGHSAVELNRKRVVVGGDAAEDL